MIEVVTPSGNHIRMGGAGGMRLHQVLGKAVTPAEITPLSGFRLDVDIYPIEGAKGEPVVGKPHSIIQEGDTIFIDFTDLTCCPCGGCDGRCKNAYPELEEAMDD